MGWEWLPEEAHTRPYNIKIGDMENLGSTGLFFSVPSRKGMDRRRKDGKRDREREREETSTMDEDDHKHIKMVNVIMRLHVSGSHASHNLAFAGAWTILN